jgi:hypothetical protein
MKLGCNFPHAYYNTIQKTPIAIANPASNKTLPSNHIDSEIFAGNWLP